MFHDREIEIDLGTAANLVVEECRMVLPGIQALLGFQFIAVFSDGFARHLDATAQRLHLGAVVLVVVAVVFAMAPAALHRLAETHTVSDRFIRASTRMLLLGMSSLSLGICLDVYLVADVILGGGPLAGGLAATLLALFVVVWVVLPVHYRRARRLA